jgi:hypothetical protein
MIHLKEAKKWVEETQILQFPSKAYSQQPENFQLATPPDITKLGPCTFGGYSRSKVAINEETNTLCEYLETVRRGHWCDSYGT